jgi:hypothetical protein
MRLLSVALYHAVGFEFNSDGDCQDINACKGFPCGANADCQDMLAPAGNSRLGRVCNCQEGYIATANNPDICAEVNAWRWGVGVLVWACRSRFPAYL